MKQYYCNISVFMFGANFPHPFVLLAMMTFLLMINDAKFQEKVWNWSLV